VGGGGVRPGLQLVGKDPAGEVIYFCRLNTVLAETTSLNINLLVGRTRNKADGTEKIEQRAILQASGFQAAGW
jgi:hypothetical protein